MLNHERNAFWKFFSIYFGSVALLILAAGFFYFGEQEKILIKKEHFSMIEFTRQLKMNMNPKNKHIKFEYKNIVIENFNMNNFTITKNMFSKYMPYSLEGKYILITKDKEHFHEKLLTIKIKIIAVQVMLLSLFAFLSYILAVRALKPMRKAITKLDNFSKDFIHDLNTPITSMFLNIKLLELKHDFTQNKPLLRIKRSLEDIGGLHDNLVILLEEDTMIIQRENIFDIISDVVSTYKKLYPHIKYIVTESEEYANINKEAFKQIIVNLVSNASKYNVENGYVKIYMEKAALKIKDCGVGIENPENIFERSYKEHSSGHGIGLDIVARLCTAMGIKINVESSVGKGSLFSLQLYS